MAARECGMSVNTYIKYLKECKARGYIRETEQGTVFIKLRDVFNDIFGKKQGKYVRVHKGFKLQFVKEEVRAAIAYYNLKQQEFNVIGNSSLDKSKKLSKKESFARSYILKKGSSRVSNAKNVLTSSRQMANVLGYCHTTANKALFRLLQRRKVFYETQQQIRFVEGGTLAKISFAEFNRPFPKCSYHLTNKGVVYHTGRIVVFNDSPLSRKYVNNLTK